MISKIKYCLLLTLLATTAMAQEKKSFTLEELMPGGRTYFQHQPANIQATWWGDRCIKTDAKECSVIDPKDGSISTLFTIDQLNGWIGTKAVNGAHGLTFPYTDRSLVLVRTAERYLLVDFEKGGVEWTLELNPAASLQDWCPANRALAYTIQGNLYVKSADGKETAVSTDGSTDGSNNIVYGQSVHRDEFGIHKGTFWSPDGTRLAFYRMDQSMVPDYPQVDINTRISSTYSCKYPMAGEASHHVTVGIFDLTTGQTTWVADEGDPERYLTNICWSPDSKVLYIQELNRGQNHCKLLQYDAMTGKPAKPYCLYEERHPKYVEPHAPLLFLPWANGQFIMQSQRDGYNHLYVCDLKKSLYGDTHRKGESLVNERIAIRQLTSGPWVVQDVLGFNPKKKSIIIVSNELHPLQRNVFSVDLKTGKRTLLGSAEGVHQPALSAGGTYLFDRYSAPDIPRNIDLTSTTNGKSIRLLTAENPWKGYNVPEISCGCIKAADDSTDLYYRMVKPVDFDPTKKYPVVVYVYGGPHAHMVDASWNYRSNGWDVYMAEKGYIAFILDNRGSENRGLAFENVTHRQLGVEEMKDQMEGVHMLMNLPYVDSDRIGVHGWSFGGFMTTNLMLTYPEVFKVGVAGGPVIDWNYYEVMYGERYMDTPQENPEGYKNSNLRLKAGKLKGKLQVIIGYNDPVCVPQHALSFLKACIGTGTQPDFFVYPGGQHNMFGRERIHLYNRITQYFEDYLK